MPVPSFASRSIRRLIRPRHRFRYFVELVVVGTEEIAPSHGNDVRHDEMVLRLAGARHNTRLSYSSLVKPGFLPVGASLNTHQSQRTSASLSANPKKGPLLNPDHHRVWSHKMLDARITEACLLHPSNAVCAGVIESAFGLDQHIQAHHQSECVLRPVVVND